ncbi:putative phosphorylase b kinase regulatory subunit beta, partial [Operophtera brumata]
MSYETYRYNDNIYAQCQLWGILMEREGPLYEVNGTNALESLKSLYHSAGVLRHWRAVRYCSSLLNHTVDSISPFITTVLEIVLYCGRLIGTNPDMFRGILKIRVGWVLEAIRIYLKLFPHEGREDAATESLSPFKLRILTPLQRRQLEGCLCRVPKHFYIQAALVGVASPARRQLCVELLCVLATILRRNPELYLQQALDLDKLLDDAHLTYAKGRQLCVELLCVLATILRRNPELYLQQALDLDKLLDDAHLTYAKRRQLCVELLCVLATILRRNPELYLQQALDLDKLLDDAHLTYAKRRQLCVELLCVLATILRRNPELYLQQALDLDKLLDDANLTYAK